MGFLDELKDKAEEFGEKAKEGFGAAKDKTEEVIENVKDRFDGDDTASRESRARRADSSAEAVSDAAEGRKQAVRRHVRFRQVRRSQDDAGLQARDLGNGNAHRGYRRRRSPAGGATSLHTA